MDSYNDIIIENVKKEHFRIASEVAAECGTRLYIVGGFVRDIILGRPRNEIDFLVLGQGITYAQKLAGKLGVTKVTIFKNFGTAHFRYKEVDFEFVGARKESYNRNSRKPVVEDGTFEDDIQRRDFTINTLAISLNKESYGEIVDKYNGMQDIENKIIRTPLNPRETFSDDPLRIMRAFRFASQLDFEVADEIKKAANEMAARLKIVSSERITDEFLKIMDSPRPSIGLVLLYETEVMKVIFPEVAELGGVDQRKDYHHKDVFYHTCEVIDNIAPHTNDTWLRIAALLHDIAKPVTKKFVEGTGWTFHGHEEIGARMIKRIFRKMKFPFAKIEYVEKLVRLHLRPIALVNDHVTDSAIRRMVVAAGEALDDLITLCRADITSKNQNKVTRYLANYDKVMLKVKEVEEKDELRAFQSPVRGDEIMKICNLAPGRKVGNIKSAIEDAILEGEIPNTYEAAYDYLLKIKDDFI
ncbi:MAG: tRNA nucleotidyltransferase [Melioribacteraceae bacterium]|nr:MAG: tRNA nucleotidyltransferase [Melioribacteraceae bacterium]